MTRTLTDLLLVPAAEWQVDDNELLTHPPAVGPQDGDVRVRNLGGGVSLEYLGDAEALMDACEPRGENWSPKRQHGQRYTFVRRGALEPRGDAAHRDVALIHCVALSRLVRANPADMRYAARVEEVSGEDRVIRPVDGFRAWVAREDRRFWLDAEDAAALSALHRRWLEIRDQLEERVRHALWLCEYGFRIQFLEVALPHYVTALEALLNTDERDSGRQFRERVPQLATALGLELDADFCREIWRNRSRATHGERVSLTDHPEAAGALDRLQEVLRLALRRCIEDDTFHDQFASSSAVRGRFSFSPRLGGKA